LAAGKEALYKIIQDRFISNSTFRRNKKSGSGERHFINDSQEAPGNFYIPDFHFKAGI